jgi:integrase
LSDAVRWRLLAANPAKDAVRPARTAAGIGLGSVHTLRHTMATRALTAGVPLHVVAARLGSDPATVLHTHAHLLPRSDEQAAKTLAAGLVDRPLTNLAT